MVGPSPTMTTECCALVDNARHPDLVQGQRCRQPADAVFVWKLDGNWIGSTDLQLLSGWERNQWPTMLGKR